jgi:hypothetical protein
MYNASTLYNYQHFGGTCYAHLDDNVVFNPEMEIEMSPEKLIAQPLNAIMDIIAGYRHDHTERVNTQMQNF